METRHRKWRFTISSWGLQWSEKGMKWESADRWKRSADFWLEVLMKNERILCYVWNYLKRKS